MTAAQDGAASVVIDAYWLVARVFSGREPRSALKEEAKIASSRPVAGFPEPAKQGSLPCALPRRLPRLAAPSRSRRLSRESVGLWAVGCLK